MEENKEKPQSRWPQLPFWLKLIFMCGVVFLASIGYFRSNLQHAENGMVIQAEPSDVPPADRRKPVPDILLVAGPGTSKKLSEFKGKVILLSFWASWCTPCLVELPTFIDLHEKLADKGLVILPVNVDEPDTATTFVGDFWKAKKFPFQTYYDPKHKSSELFRVDSLPSNFVLDKQGRLVAQGYGANDWSSETSIKFIEQLLSE